MVSRLAEEERRNPLAGLLCCGWWWWLHKKTRGRTANIGQKFSGEMPENSMVRILLM
jgi:hypothetical protein